MTSKQSLNLPSPTQYIFYIIIIFFILNQPLIVSGEIALSASVVNEPPRIVHHDILLQWHSPQNYLSVSNTSLCSEDNISVLIHLRDDNGGLDIQAVDFELFDAQGVLLAQDSMELVLLLGLDAWFQAPIPQLHSESLGTHDFFLVFYVHDSDTLQGTLKEFSVTSHNCSRNLVSLYPETEIRIVNTSVANLVLSRQSIILSDCDELVCFPHHNTSQPIGSLLFTQYFVHNNTFVNDTTLKSLGAYTNIALSAALVFNGSARLELPLFTPSTLADMNHSQNHPQRNTGISWWNATWKPLSQKGVHEQFAWGITHHLGDFRIETFEKRSGSCRPLWLCTSWSACLNHTQNRTCFDVLCGQTQDKPLEIKPCGIVAVDDTKQPVEEPPIRLPHLLRDNTVLFDIYLDVLTKELFRNQKLLVKIGLINFGDEGVVYARVRSRIHNSEDIVVFEQNHDYPVQTQVEFLQEYDFKLKPGIYTLELDLFYEGQLYPARAFEQFSIIPHSQEVSTLQKILVVVLALLLVTFLFLLHSPRRPLSKIVPRK